MATTSDRGLPDHLSRDLQVGQRNGHVFGLCDVFGQLLDGEPAPASREGRERELEVATNPIRQSPKQIISENQNPCYLASRSPNQDASRARVGATAGQAEFYDFDL
jgi:hypothetical protein